MFAEGKFKFSMESIFDKQSKYQDPVDDEQPSLEEMTIAAINILQKSPSGSNYQLVEYGRKFSSRISDNESVPLA